MTETSIRLRVDDSAVRPTLRRTEGDFRRSGRSVGQGFGGQASAGVEQLLGRLGQVPASLSGIGVAAGAAVGAVVALGAAAVRVGQASLAVSRPVETALAQVATIADSTQFDIARVRESARALAGEFGTDIRQQVQSYYQAISAGATTSASATDVLRAANLLAQGGLTDTTTAIRGLTAIVNSYASTGLTATEVSDRLFAAIRLGKTSAEELSSSLGQVTPIASSVGLSFDAVAASVATITQAGVSTSEAVTQLRSLLLSLLAPTTEAKDIARQLGIEFSEARLRAVGLAGVLEDIRRSGATNEQIARLTGRVEALNGILNLSAESGRRFVSTLSQVEASSGAAAAAQRIIGDTAEAQSARVTAAYSQILESIGSLIQQSGAYRAALDFQEQAVVGLAQAVERLARAEESIPATGRDREVLEEVTRRRGIERPADRQTQFRDPNAARREQEEARQALEERRRQQTEALRAELAARRQAAAQIQQVIDRERAVLAGGVAEIRLNGQARTEAILAPLREAADRAGPAGARLLAELERVEQIRTEREVAAFREREGARAAAQREQEERERLRAEEAARRQVEAEDQERLRAIDEVMRRSRSLDLQLLLIPPGAADEVGQRMAEVQARLDVELLALAEREREDREAGLVAEEEYQALRTDALRRAEQERSRIREEAARREIDLAVSVAQQVGSIVGSLTGLVANNADARIEAVKRSGAAEADIEAQTQEIRRRAFEEQQRFQIAQAIINTAAGVTQALASSPPPASFFLAAAVAAAGALQVVKIATTQPGGGGSVSVPSPPSASQFREQRAPRPEPGSGSAGATVIEVNFNAPIDSRRARREIADLAAGGRR